MFGGLLVYVIAGGAALADEPFAAHRIVAIKSIDGMPADIAPLFRQHRAELERRVIEPGVEWPGDRKLRRYNRWHHVQADIGSGQQTRADRLRAFRSFPQNQVTAERLYRRLGRQGGGLLPWAIDECYRRLVEAFKSEETSEVIARAGHLAHFVADAVNPFRSSANDNGVATGNLRMGSVWGVHPTSVNHSVRERFGAGLVARYSTTYADALTLTTASYQPIWNPVADAFEMIESALSVLDDVAQADKEILTTLEIVDRKSFEARKEAYYIAMNDRCGDICLSRLEACAILTANLVGSAWQEAGEPSLEAIRARGEGGTTATPSAEAMKEGSYVGSKHSNIFHKPDCRWARQISQDNLVTFTTSLEARQASRRACKTCKPK